MPKERITDEMFVREMSILWQGLDVPHRKKLGHLIRDYFNTGVIAFHSTDPLKPMTGYERAELIIDRMMEKIAEDIT